MKQFWYSLTDRERYLMLGAGTLLFFLLMVVFVLLPLGTAREEAERFETDAENQFALVSALSAEAKVLKADGASASASRTEDSSVSRRALISRSARSSGITISRIQPNDNGALTLWADSVSSQSFYAWVRSLDAEHGLAPDNVSLQSQQDGTLRVQIQFQGVTN